MEGTKRKLSLNLSFLNLTDFARQGSARKSPRNFEQPNGAVGLGILAAMVDHRRDGDPDLSRKTVVAISPKSASNAIPILGKNDFLKENGGKHGELEESDEYTCVISHVGKNLLEKREYFGSVSAESVLGSTRVSLIGSCGTAAVHSSSFCELIASDFLNSCFLCKKMLQGLDIFMYRGDMAFCSPECRDMQISIEKKEEKYQSRLRKQMEYSVSPCSDSQSFSAKVVAA